MSLGYVRHPSKHRSYRDFALVQVGRSRSQRDSWLAKARLSRNLGLNDVATCVSIARDRNHEVIYWLREAREHIESQLTAARSAA